MSAWATYADRIGAHGNTFRDASFNREVRMLNKKIPRSLSYFTVDMIPREYTFNINDEESMKHQFQQNVVIIDADNLNEKTICSLPGEDVQLGALLYWQNNYWMVAERDANMNVYTKAKLLQCNHLLRWLSKDLKIMEQWCVVEDGTKYRERYTFTGRCSKRNSLNCWESLKPIIPQYKMK